MSKTAVWFIIAFIICICICGISISFIFIGQHQKSNGSVGGNTDTTRAVVTELAGEQQQALSRAAAAIDTVERVRRITAETDSSLGELGLLDRRSSDIYAQIRAELKIMEDYFRSVSNILGDYDNSAGGKEVNE